MSRAAASLLPDRVRYPFVTPAEKEEMQAALKREQAADPFNDRAPLKRAVGDETGLLGVPRTMALVSDRSRRPIMRTTEGAKSLGSDPIRKPDVAAIAGDPPVAPLESEELRGIRRFLAEEIGRIESVVVAHFARNAEPSTAGTEISPVTADTGSASPEPSVVPPDWARPLAEAGMYPGAMTSGPIDLDEAQNLKRANQAAMASQVSDDQAAARAAVPEQFVPKRRVANGGLQPTGRQSTSARTTEAGDNDMPVFLQDATSVLPAASPRRPAGSRPAEPIVPASVRQLLADPLPPIRVQQREGFGPAAGSASTWGALILAYAVFALIPVTEWLSGTLDPRIGAFVPAIAFLGWLSIHALRRDQLFQLRILTAWQVAHAAGGLHAIRPWGGSPAAVYWMSAAIAVAGALVVVALSAVVETYEYRSARTQAVPRRQFPSSPGRPRDMRRVPAE